MVYDKFLISLYSISSPLPKAFVVIHKRAEELFACIEQSKFEGGLLYICSSKGVIGYEVKEKDKAFKLPSDFSFESSYYVKFITRNDSLTGKRGIGLDIKQIEERIDGCYKEMIRKQKQTLALCEDKNILVDQIVYKMFGSCSTAFFESTEKQLFTLFSNCKRASEIEKIIPCSKFVKSGTKGDEAYVGIVYKNNLPYAIGIGFAMDSQALELVHENSYQLFYAKEKGLEKNKTYFMSFRKASDGDLVWI